MEADIGHMCLWTRTTHELASNSFLSARKNRIYRCAVWRENKRTRMTTLHYYTCMHAGWCMQAAGTSCPKSHPTIPCTLVGTTSLWISIDIVYLKGPSITTELALFLAPLEVTHCIHQIVYMLSDKTLRITSLRQIALAKSRYSFCFYVLLARCPGITPELVLFTGPLAITQSIHVLCLDSRIDMEA